MKKILKKIARVLPESLYSVLADYYHDFFDKYPKITPLPHKVSSNLRNCYAWFENAAHYLHVNRMEGAYVEFGSHEINTFRFALNTLGNYKRWGYPGRIRHFYAFDSFEGMPEPHGIDKQKIWRASMNFTSEERFKKVCKLDSYRITTVKGFYEDVLPEYKWNNNHQIVLAYVDSDYYSSAIEVLKFIKDKLAHGAILTFDDWNCYYGDPERGEKKAFAEFKEKVKNEAHFEPFLPISFGGTSFIYLKKALMGKEIL